MPNAVARNGAVSPWMRVQPVPGADGAGVDHQGHLDGQQQGGDREGEQHRLAGVAQERERVGGQHRGDELGAR